jgi:hypothetical protein
LYKKRSPVLITGADQQLVARNPSISCHDVADGVGHVFGPERLNTVDLLTGGGSGQLALRPVLAIEIAAPTLAPSTAVATASATA